MASKKILIVCDKFKDTLKASEVAAAITSSLNASYGIQLQVTQMPISDGGEGFLESMELGLITRAHLIITGSIQ